MLRYMMLMAVLGFTIISRKKLRKKVCTGGGR